MIEKFCYLDPLLGYSLRKHVYICKETLRKPRGLPIKFAPIYFVINEKESLLQRTHMGESTIIIQERLKANLAISQRLSVN